MQKQEQVHRFTEQILNRIRTSFQNHRRRIDKLNSQKSYPGGLMKNETAQSFYGNIPTMIQQLQNLFKQVRKSQKLRKQRRTMYQKKVNSFIQTLQMIRKNGLLIKIKINNALVKLAAETIQTINQAMNNLKNFDKEAGMMCGKSYDFKPAVQSSMTILCQYGFLWANLTKFQSITNDSVNQIYIPVKFEENQFKSIINQVRAIWPTPQIIRQKEKVPQIQIKDDSQLREAHELLFGFTRSQNVPKAIQIYLAQIQKSKSHPSAWNALGDIFQSGKFVKKDMNKAVHYYKKSADKNDPEGLYKIGQYLEKGYINSKQIFSGLYPNRQSQIRGGIQYYQKAAKLGHLDAMADLGYIYQKGVKIQPNGNYCIEPHPQHALKYYLKTKQNEFPRGYNNLGTFLITCPTLSQQAEGGNLMKGIKYLEKATQLKYPRAFLNLAKCYQNGLGVTQNMDKARALYVAGAELGDTQCKLDYVKSCLGTSIDDEQILLRMVELTRQVLIQDDRNAMALYYMGLFFEQGVGVEKNIESSHYYINMAARLQYPPALTKLGDFYFTGQGVKKDLQYAKMLYQKAASKGDSKALINIGVMMEKGVGFESKDPKRAYQYYEEAAAMGNTDAMIILSSTGQHLKPVQAVNKANQIGSNEAAKILKSTHIFAPFKEKTSQNYTETLKTLQNFYVKTSQIKKRA